MIENKTVSLVMPVYNVWEYTSKCINSIIETKTPFDEFVIINNASNDGTTERLRDWQVKDGRFKIINNNINRGVGPAWNQGIKNSSGEYICIINNDLIFREGWLEEMVRMSIKFGKKVVIPQYTSGSKPTTFPDPPKKKDEPGWSGKLQKGKIEDGHFKGYCFLVHRIVFERTVGYFDEQFEMWWYEDSDFLERLSAVAKQDNDPSYISTKALGAYIHHFESKTLFNEKLINPKTRNYYIFTNQKRYEKKHSKPPS